LHVVTTMCWALDGSTQNAGQVSSRVPGQTDPPTRGRLLDDPFDIRPSALTLVHQSEIDDIVQAAILTLPDRQRSAILFVHQEGHTNIVTAEIMGISVEAVESLLARGRRRLRHTLADLFPDLKGGTS